MKISVLGHYAKDFFHTQPDGEQESVIEHPGGILYSVLTLANLISEKDTLIPIFGVTNSEYDGVIERLKPFTNIETKGIFTYKGAVNQVHYFGEYGSHVECSKEIAPPIPFSKIKQFVDVDGILLNMVSGFDITLETLDQIRIQARDLKVHLHFDFHSLTLGIDQEQKRFRRPLSEWRRWCFMMNSIQLSDTEASELTLEQYNEESLINQTMTLMVNALVITRGKRGATLIHQEHKKLFRHDIEGIESESLLSTLGCGDVFGAAFLYKYLKTQDWPAAVLYANQAASIKTSFFGTDGLQGLRKKMEADNGAPSQK
ncbi:MAG: PfkB family carbohydrate kinase [bacterium]